MLARHGLPVAKTTSPVWRQSVIATIPVDQTDCNVGESARELRRGRPSVGHVRGRETRAQLCRSYGLMTKAFGSVLKPVPSRLKTPSHRFHLAKRFGFVGLSGELSQQALVVVGEGQVFRQHGDVVVDVLWNGDADV